MSLPTRAVASPLWTTTWMAQCRPMFRADPVIMATRPAIIGAPAYRADKRFVAGLEDVVASFLPKAELEQRRNDARRLSWAPNPSLIEIMML